MYFGMRQYARAALRAAVGAARALIDEFSRDRVGGLSAEIAFFALLSFFPALIVLAALLGSIDAVVSASAAQEVEDWIVAQIVRIFGGDNTLEATVNDLFDGPSTSALTIGAVLAVYASTRGFIAVVGALDVAYDHSNTRGWISTRLVGFGIALMSLVVAVVVMVALVVGPLFGGGGRLSDAFGLGAQYATLWNWLRWPVAFLVMTGWAAAVYHIAPNHRAPWRIELPGALLAAVWWSVVSVGFSTYLSIVAQGANVVFGFLGGALSLLFWLYLMAMGLLVGAEVNSLLATRRGIPLDREPRRESWRRRRVRSPDDGIQGAT